MTTRMALRWKNGDGRNVCAVHFRLEAILTSSLDGTWFQTLPLNNDALIRKGTEKIRKLEQILRFQEAGIEVHAQWIHTLEIG